MDPNSSQAILIVDDDVHLCTSVRRLLSSEGYAVSEANDAKSALDLLSRQPFQVLLSDQGMPGMTGVELLRQVRREYPAIQRLLLTGGNDPHAAEEAINEAAVFRYLLKPCDGERLLETVRAAFKEYRLEEEGRRIAALTERHSRELEELATSLEAKVSERTRLLARAKNEWERTFDAIDRPIAVLERDLRVVRANLAYAKLAATPIREVPGRLCHELLFKRSSPCPECALATGCLTGSFELAGPRTFVVNGYEADGRFVCIYRETTEERSLLRQQIQTEKFAAVGRLAGGVAHEINNPLGAILAFTQVLLSDAGHTAEDLVILRDVEHAALRCKSIVESLLRFSRRGPASKALLDVNKAVQEACVLFSAQVRCRPKAQLKTDICKEPMTVLGDPNEIEQVVLNLLINALQALPDGKGVVTVTTRSGGGWAEVAIHDNGAGILPEHRSKIFDLGFTTKPAGEGTGFGLPISWGIAQAHGGRLDVESAPGIGTTFTLRLPAASASPAPEPAERSAP
jgi:two-component system, NtrC family, sensor kinase